MTKKKETIINVALIAGLTGRIIYSGADASVYIHAFYSLEKRRYLCAGCSFHEPVKRLYRTVFSWDRQALCFWVPIHMESLPFRWNREKVFISILTAVSYSLLFLWLWHLIAAGVVAAIFAYLIGLACTSSEKRLSGDCHTWLCGNHPCSVPVG